MSCSSIGGSGSGALKGSSPKPSAVSKIAVEALTPLPIPLPLEIVFRSGYPKGPHRISASLQTILGAGISSNCKPRPVHPIPHIVLVEEAREVFEKVLAGERISP